MMILMNPRYRALRLLKKQNIQFINPQHTMLLSAIEIITKLN